jgi:hypothetical protein
MKKEVIITIILLFVLYGGLSIYLITSAPKISKEPSLSPLTLFTPYVPQNCSSSELLQVWSSVFQTSGANLVTKNESSQQGKCSKFIMIESLTNPLRFIYGSDVESGTKIVYVKAGYVGYETNYFDTIIQPNITDVNTTITQLLSLLTSSSNLTARSITTIGEADTHYRGLFLNAPPSWRQSNLDGITTFNFTEIESNTTITRSIFGEVIGNYTYTNSEYKTETGACIINWTEYTTDCSADETNITYFLDENNCQDYSDYPGNQTNNCDYDGNGIIGDEDDIIDTNIDVDVYIDGNRLNLSLDYNSTRTIEIREDNIVRVTFDHNFSVPLDLKAIEIKKQTSSASKGYLIINGIEKEKTVRVDKKNSSSGQVCIEDKEINSISSVSDDCDESGEVLAGCPGSSGGFNCSISDNYFVVSGLDHSAVEEFLNGSSEITCTSSWNCTAWSECTNNQKTRSCTDLNNCAANTTETESCGTTACTSLWNCTAWSPEICPKNETQTRSCTDLNNCAPDKNEPRTCEYKSNTLLIIIIIAGILLAGALITLFYLIKNKPQTTTSSSLSPPSIMQQPPPPPNQNQDPFTYRSV